MTNYEEVEPLAEVVLEFNNTWIYAPWLPEPDCREYQSERYLTQEQKDLVQTWVENGTPMGDPLWELQTCHKSRVWMLI